MRIILFVWGLHCLFSRTTIAQSGCTDPQALNYAISATINDGSCTYPITYYYPIFQANLPGALKEISGLDSLGNRWWAHADSGNENLIYSIDVESGDILQEVKLKNAQNRDWEDLCADATNLYIADLGNNQNDRENLGFYKVPLIDIGNDNTETVNEDEYTWIPLNYEDQFDFSTQSEEDTEFDCEAVLNIEGKLHVFTKDRKNNHCTHYILNETTGVAENIEILNTQGVITGADISPDGKLIALLGYNITGVPSVFCYLLWNWHDGFLFNGNKRRIELGTAFQTGQAESIAFADNRSGYIANEITEFGGTTFVEETIQRFDFTPFVSEPVSVIDFQSPENALVSISPNPFSTQISVTNTDVSNQIIKCIARNALGQVMDSRVKDFTFQTHQWPSGSYFFQVQMLDGRSINKALLKPR